MIPMRPAAPCYHIFHGRQKEYKWVWEEPTYRCIKKLSFGPLFMALARFVKRILCVGAIDPFHTLIQSNQILDSAQGNKLMKSA